MSKPTAKFLLRNYPDDDALQHPEKYSKALSFCPDILPRYGMDHDQGSLVDPASLRGFSGLPIVAGDVNNVYIRGYGSGGPYIASLWVMPSELILWPHVWQNVKPVPSGPVVIPGGDAHGPYACDGPFQFRPSHTTGNTYSLVANLAAHIANQEVVPQTFDLKTFGVDDFVHFLSTDQTFGFYNVIVADPTLKQVAATTRLRMIGNSPVPLTFRLDWHTGTPAPHGLEVSLVDDRGRIVVPRVSFAHFRDHTVVLEPSYDGILMLNIFAPEESAHFEPYSGLSLQVFKGGVHNAPLLGALNIIFEPHGTRNIRFASPAASQLKSQNAGGDNDAKALAVSGPIPVTNPATGWWTRATLKDNNRFPHNPIGISPDIQPVGTNLGAKDFLTILQNPGVDYSGGNRIELVGNANNYFYIRGHSTLSGIDLQGRLFALPISTINHPAKMLKEALQAQVVGGKGIVNDQSISVASPNQFYLFEKPFSINHPPNPRGHYCLIAEVRQKRQDCPVFPGWPTDHAHNFATLADLEAWVTHSSLMCWRNIIWEPCQPGGKPTWTWSCNTQLCIPDTSSYCVFWSIIVECDNANIPAGSTWSLVCDDNKLFPNGTVFSTRPITDANAPPFAGVHFTGARPGYTANLTLTVTWSGDGSKIPPPSIQWKLAMTETQLSPIGHLALDPPPGSDEWPLHVTQDYPYIGNKPNPSPLPSFKASGSNAWPYKGHAHFQLGQASLAAKLE